MTRVAWAPVLLLAMAGEVLAQRPVVELFTSEGCSSCPAGEEVLAKLVADKDDPVIGLAYHVDYWNKLGWTDPFSRAEWSQRQGRYASTLGGDEVYTPQAVVDGAAACVGSGEAELRGLVAKARAKKPAVRVELAVKRAAGKLAVTAKLEEGKEEASGLTVSLVVYEDGLASDVKAGENEGKHLAHVHVVRKLVEATEETTQIPLDAAWKPEKLGVAALVQDARLRVVGAAAAAVQ